MARASSLSFWDYKLFFFKRVSKTGRKIGKHITTSPFSSFIEHKINKVYNNVA